MKKKSFNIEWSSMTGMGPGAWDRDRSRLSMHTRHGHHEEKHHIVQRGKGRTQPAHNTDHAHGK